MDNRKLIPKKKRPTPHKKGFSHWLNCSGGANENTSPRPAAFAKRKLKTGESSQGTNTPNGATA